MPQGQRGAAGGNGPSGDAVLRPRADEALIQDQVSENAEAIHRVAADQNDAGLIDLIATLRLVLALKVRRPTPRHNVEISDYH